MYALSAFVKDFRQWVLALSFRTKITVIISCCVVLPTLLLGVSAYHIAAASVKRTAVERTVQSTRQISEEMNERFVRVMRNFNAFFRHEQFRLAIHRSAIGDLEEFETDFRKVESIISNYRISDKLIDGVYIYTTYAVYYDSSRYCNIRVEDSSYEEYLNAYREKLENGSVQWVRAVDYGQWESLLNPSAAIVIAPFMFNVSRREVVGVITLNDRVLRGYLAALESDFVSQTYLINQTGEIITHVGVKSYDGPLPESILRNVLKPHKAGWFLDEIGKHRIICTYALVPLNGWRLVTIMPLQELLRYATHINHLTILVIVVSLAVGIGISILFSRSVTKPLMNLHHVLSRVRRRDFRVRFHHHGMDEIGQIAITLNLMLDEISLLIGQLHEEKIHVRKEQQLKHKAELRALQAQINPHFLYNTFNAIYWKSISAGNAQISEMALSLSRIFQLGINRVQQVVCIWQEVKLVESYLYIQKQVYGSRFDYRIEIDPGTRESLILKFTIQPLVENSILHGFTNMESGGLVTVSAVRDGGSVRIIVRDNGQGFDARKVRGHMSQYNEPRFSYGLWNIYHRLNLYYGDQFRMRLHSRQYEDTSVTIEVPLHPMLQNSGGGRGNWMVKYV